MKGVRRISYGENDEFKLNMAQQRILDALAWYESNGNNSPTLNQVGAVALIAAPSGHFNNTIGPLSSHGLITRNGDGTMSLTDKGRPLAAVPDSVSSLRAYHEVLLNRVRKVKSAGGKTVEMLEAIIESGEAGLTNEELSQKVGTAYPSGHFNNMIGPLSTLGLIRRREGRNEPTEIIFPRGLV